MSGGGSVKLVFLCSAHTRSFNDRVTCIYNSGGLFLSYYELSSESDSAMFDRVHSSRQSFRRCYKNKVLILPRWITQRV
jgi:hypothetical protein